MAWSAAYRVVTTLPHNWSKIVLRKKRGQRPVDNVMKHSLLQLLASTGVCRTRDHRDVGSARRGGLCNGKPPRGCSVHAPSPGRNNRAKIGTLPRRHEASQKLEQNGLRKRALFFFLVFNHHFYFPSQLVGVFTLSDLLDKPWSQVQFLSPPGTCLHFSSRIWFTFPLLIDFHRMLLTNGLALSANQFLRKKKSLRVCALGENGTHEIDFSRHEDNLPSHQGRRLAPLITSYLLAPLITFFLQVLVSYLLSSPFFLSPSWSSLRSGVT